MNITVKTLDKIKNIYLSIQELDREIIQIEKLAAVLSQDNCSVKLSLEVENHSKKEKDPVLDEDGSLSTGKYANPWDDIRKFYGLISPKINKIATDSHSFNINEREALYVLQALLRVKKDLREALIQELSKYGIEI